MPQSAWPLATSWPVNSSFPVGPGASTNFAALATANGLAVRAYFRADVGVSGSTGTGKSAWANQSGTAGNMAPGTGATNGIGTPGTGLGGKASIITDGSTQCALFTMPAQSQPAVTSIHKWWIGRKLVAGAANVALFDGAGTVVVYSTPGAEHVGYEGAASVSTSGAVLNTWYRGRVSYTGSASDVIRLGAISTSGAMGTSLPTTTRGVFSNSDGTGKGQFEMLAYLELEGTLANFLAYDAVAGPAAQVEWSNAILI